ncbi:MAG: 2-oxo acid dehydrogenase subunit E2 [Candidatus Krumholzibacteriia bacterium]
MIKEVRLPEIAENVETGDVIKVMVAQGDEVAADQPLVELETDKAVLEVPSPYAGTVTEILVSEGETIKIDQVIVKIDTAAKEESRTPKKRPDVPKRETPAVRAEHPAPTPIRPEAPAPTASTTPAPQVAEASATGAIAAASPSLRRLARELGVDIHDVSGSGPGGRILKDDLTTYARNVVAGSSAATPKTAANGATENTKWGPIVREPMSKVRQVTARAMSHAWTTIPHVTQYDKVDITEMEAIRKQYNKKIEPSGGKLTMTAILLKVAASALKVFPQFNSSIDADKNEVILKRYYHLGVAVDTDRGLLVPVVRSVDAKNIAELSTELNDLAERARNKKLTLEEMDGGTFTISNLGGIGGTNFSPIVYAPQVAIMGVARSRIEPVYADGRFEPRLMLPLSVSYDHRIIDGADAARFLRWIVQALEEPLLLALEG